MADLRVGERAFTLSIIILENLKSTRIEVNYEMMYYDNFETHIYLTWVYELDIIINSHLQLSREWMWCYCGKIICYQAMRTHVDMNGNTCSRWWSYFLTWDTKMMCVHFSNFYDLTKIPCKYSLQSYHAISDRILSICAQCTRLLLFYDLPVPAINV